MNGRPLTNRQYRIWKKSMELGKKIFKCHQLPERSFFYKGMQFPLCARCTGIFLGFVIIGPIVSVITFGNMFLSLFFILLMFIDGFFQLKKIWKSTNLRRLVTGLLSGYATFSIIVHIVTKIIDLIS